LFNLFYHQTRILWLRPLTKMEIIKYLTKLHLYRKLA